MKFLKLFIKKSSVYFDKLSMTSESGKIRDELTNSDFEAGEEVYLIDKETFEKIKKG